MKDRNGNPIQVGDVCVDHTRIDGDFGELCAIVEPDFLTIPDDDSACIDYGTGQICSWRNTELLEIIGSVRDE